MIVNACGYYCEECQHLDNTCEGCNQVKGKPFWTVYYESDSCPIYVCAKTKKLSHCGKCPELPCKIWYELHDPSLSDEEHLSSIEKRSALLRGLDS